MKVLQSKEIEVKSSKSILSFETTGGGSWRVWDRFLAIDGRKAFHLGNICGTCNFFFERLEGANQTVSRKNVIEVLADTSITLDSDPYFEIETLVPKSKYLVLRMQLTPLEVKLGGENDYFTNEQIDVWGLDGFWGMPHNPKIPYYRSESFEVDNRSVVHSFYVPIVPENWLNAKRINEYTVKMRNGTIPTVVAISYLDVKEPADYEDNQLHTEHICFSNIVLDGHHKMLAAARSERPINVISFLSIENSRASDDDIERFKKILNA